MVYSIIAGLIVAASASAASTVAEPLAQAPNPKHRAASEIRVVEVPASLAIVRQMRGDYSQHRAAAAELLQTASSTYRELSVPFGEYPDDPDAVGMANVQWQLGVYLPTPASLSNSALKRRLGSISAPPAPYMLASYPKVKAAVLTTTFSRSREDGLRIFGWIVDNGFVQIGPTRMEYLDGDAQADSSVRIVVPVEARKWAAPHRGSR